MRIPFHRAVFVAVTLVANAAYAQDGISAEPLASEESLVPPSSDKGIFDVLVPGTLIAGLHLIKTGKVLEVDTDRFHFGPVAKPDDLERVCLLMQSLNGRYRGRWTYGVTQPTDSLIRRTLKSEHREPLKSRFTVGSMLLVGSVSENCSNIQSDVLVASGFSEAPDRLEVILSMRNGFPDVRLIGSADGEEHEMDCSIIDSPVGFRCRSDLADLTDDLYTLRVEVDLMDGNDPTVVESKLALVPASVN